MNVVDLAKEVLPGGSDLETLVDAATTYGLERKRSRCCAQAGGQGLLYGCVQGLWEHVSLEGGGNRSKIFGAVEEFPLNLFHLHNIECFAHGGCDVHQLQQFFLVQE